MSKFVHNPQVQSWINGGHAVPALLGEGAFFIANPTYRDLHDRLLVIRQLILWAMEHDTWDDAATSFLEALCGLVNTRRSTEAYDLVWSYLLVRRDMHEELPVELSAIRAQLQQLGVVDTQLDAHDRLKGLVDAVAAALAQ